MSQSLERGLAILALFTSDRPLLGVSELARALGLSRSTAHRYVATLAELGYLQQDRETSRYRLGPRVLDLGFSAINSMDVREISIPHLQQLSDETGHTVNMAILDGSDIVYIERCRASRPGQQAIDLNLHIGARLPAYCTAMGKLLLANLPESDQRELLSQIKLTKQGPNSITSKKALREELDEVLDASFAVDDEEFAKDLYSIAAPVRNEARQVVAAVDISVPSSIISLGELVDALGPHLVSTADRISARLGFRRDDEQG
jgi:IclR family pca regulon transcriptional regulator